MATEQSTKVITGEVRFSYLHVFEPTSMENDEAKKYSVSLIIPKSDKVTIAKIEAAIAAAKELGKSKWGGKIPAKLTLPLRDGDVDRPEDEAYANSYFINAKSSNKPGIVNENLDPIMDKDEVFSGCFGRASINFFPYAKKSNGVACGLNNLMKLRDGEALGGGRTSAEDDFAAFAGSAAVEDAF